MTAGANVSTETRSAQALPVEKRALAPAVTKGLRQKLIAGKVAARSCVTDATMGKAAYKPADRDHASDVVGGALGHGIPTGLLVCGVITAGITTLVLTKSSTP